MPLFKKPGPSADFEKVKGGALPKRDTNLENIHFWGKGPKIYKAKTRLALRLPSKGLFYIRAMSQFIFQEYFRMFTGSDNEFQISLSTNFHEFILLIRLFWPKRLNKK